MRWKITSLATLSITNNWSFKMSYIFILQAWLTSTLLTILTWNIRSSSQSSLTIQMNAQMLLEWQTVSMFWKQWFPRACYEEGQGFWEDLASYSISFTSMETAEMKKRNKFVTTQLIICTGFRKFSREHERLKHLTCCLSFHTSKNVLKHANLNRKYKFESKQSKNNIENKKYKQNRPVL